MNVVVTGGSGGLGREVVTAAAAKRRDRDGGQPTDRSRPEHGGRTRAALAGAEVIVHAATHPARYRAVDLDGTRKIISVHFRSAGPAHLVYVSIVGCDRNPYPYYRAKYACELALERSGLPVTVVRATQFHTLVADPRQDRRPRTDQSCSPRCPSSPATIGGWPRSGRHRARRRAARVPPPPTWPGRSRSTSARLSSWSAQAEGKPPPRVIQLPVVGGTLSAFAWGTNLPGPRRLGGSSFPDWLRR